MTVVQPLKVFVSPFGLAGTPSLPARETTRIHRQPDLWEFLIYAAFDLRLVGFAIKGLASIQSELLDG